jgi:hypothetical protein
LIPDELGNDLTEQFVEKLGLEAPIHPAELAGRRA